MFCCMWALVQKIPVYFVPTNNFLFRSVCSALAGGYVLLCVFFLLQEFYENAIYTLFPKIEFLHIWMEFTGSKLRCHLNTPVTHWGVVISQKVRSPQKPWQPYTPVWPTDHVAGVPFRLGQRAGRCPVPSHTSHMTPALKVTHTQPPTVWLLRPGLINVSLRVLLETQASLIESGNVQTPLIDVHSGKTHSFPKHHCFLPQIPFIFLNYFPSLKIPASIS